MLSPLAKADGERRKGISSSSFLKEEPKLPELLIAPLSAARERQGERERERKAKGVEYSLLIGQKKARWVSERKV